MTFDPLEQPIGPRSPALGREGSGDGAGERLRGEQGKGEEKVIPCIGAAGGIAQMMLRREGYVWRKKKPHTTVQGLCFYIYNPTRQAELKEGYMRQRHLRNKLWGPHSLMWCTVMAPRLLQSLHTAADSALPAGKGLFPAALVHVQGFSCATGLEPVQGLGDPVPSDTL